MSVIVAKTQQVPPDSQVAYQNHLTAEAYDQPVSLVHIHYTKVSVLKVSSEDLMPPIKQLSASHAGG